MMREVFVRNVHFISSGWFIFGFLSAKHTQKRRSVPVIIHKNKEEKDMRKRKS
jgi:hypothetical protein